MVTSVTLAHVVNESQTKEHNLCGGYFQNLGYVWFAITLDRSLYPNYTLHFSINVYVIIYFRNVNCVPVYGHHSWISILINNIFIILPKWKKNDSNCAGFQEGHLRSRNLLSGLDTLNHVLKLKKKMFPWLKISLVYLIVTIKSSELNSVLSL